MSAGTNAATPGLRRRFPSLALPSQSTAWLVVTASVAALLLTLYVAQLSLGRWQVDEYWYFFDQRVFGWRALLARLYVSPRPFSELLIYGYGAVVRLIGWPAVVEALAVLWAGLAISMVLAARSSLGPGPARWPAALSLALSQFVFVLVTNPVTQVFYWPVAAAAYLPTLAGAVSLLFLLRDDMSPVRKACCGGALLLAASSHEVGSAMAIGFAMAVAAQAVAERRRPATARGDAAWEAWWIVPGVLGLAVMASLVLFRSGINDLGADTKAYTGHFIASVIAAARQLAMDAVTLGYSANTTAAFADAIAAKAMLASGFALVWFQAGGGKFGRWHAALAFGLLIAAFFSLFAAYYHYGDLCCERQATTRHWLIDVILIIGAVAMLGRISNGPDAAPLRTAPAWLGPVLLMVSLHPVAFRFDGIQKDFAFMGMASDARARTWASGSQANTSSMEFYLPPASDDMLVRGTSQPIGTYRLDGETPDIIAAMGRFFGKTVVTTCQPWQLPQSWLIDGRFIPACPPHDGPPDRIHISH